jgi:hypothetical protein
LRLVRLRDALLLIVSSGPQVAVDERAEKMTAWMLWRAS